MPFWSLTDKKERDRIAKEYAGVTSRLKDRFQKEKIADAEAKEKLIQKTEPVTSAMTSVILGNPDDEDTGKAVVPALKKQTAELKKDNEALKKQQEIQHKELKKITSAVQNLPIDLSYALDKKTDPEEFDDNLPPEVEELREKFLEKFLNEVYELQYDELDDDKRIIIRDQKFQLPSDLVTTGVSSRSELENVIHKASKKARNFGCGKRGTVEDNDLNESGKKFFALKAYIEVLEKIMKKLDVLEAELDKIRNKSGNTNSEDDITTIMGSQAGEGVHTSKNVETTQIEKAYPISTYVYYSDPNELVERLELLVASKNAGNNGVLNEISAILDELLKHWDLSKDDYTSLNRNLVLGT
jgi:hypothetical protein